MKLRSALRVISAAFLVIATSAVSGSHERGLENGGLHTDLNDDGCEVGSEGTAACKSNALKSNCSDDHIKCPVWASTGECDNNPNYMRTSCRKSCNNCPAIKTEDDENDTTNAEDKEYLNAIQEYGKEQIVDGARSSETMSNIREAVVYMRDYVHAEKPTHNMSHHVLTSCKNQHDMCAYWAVIGECDVNPAYMATNCGPACQSCEKIDMKTRCGTRDPNMRPALDHGGLNLMFERIVQMAPGNQTEASRIAAREGKLQDDGSPYYTVNVHSRPASNSPPPDENTGIIPVDRGQDLKEDPWVITMDNFLTEEECDYLIDFGHKNGYERSRDVGGVKFDGSFDSTESKTRTSANAWCDEKSGCRTNPAVQRIMQRLEKATQIPTDSFEDFQMLKYEVGQFYRLHHDYIDQQEDRLCGPRILTFFLYLSDVDEAGGTGFEDLGIVVTPKKGRALLWPSVMNHDPSLQDGRTRHEALTVKKGTKFAANAWIHLYNYVDSQKLGCA